MFSFAFYSTVKTTPLFTLLSTLLSTGKFTSSFPVLVVCRQQALRPDVVPKIRGFMRFVLAHHPRRLMVALVWVMESLLSTLVQLASYLVITLTPPRRWSSVGALLVKNTLTMPISHRMPVTHLMPKCINIFTFVFIFTSAGACTRVGAAAGDGAVESVWWALGSATGHALGSAPQSATA